MAIPSFFIFLQKNFVRQETIEIDGIGEVTATCRKGSKRISIRIKNDGKIAVNYPWLVSRKEVLHFVNSQVEWIKKTQLKFNDRKHYFEIGNNFCFRNISLSIIGIEHGKVRAVRKDTAFTITIPADRDIRSENIQLFIKKVLTEILRAEAKMHLPGRVKELASAHGFSYNMVYIKNLKSKWGSCSSLGNINLNLALMTLPDHLIDYIILHELSHTREPNHGARFWAVLQSVTNGKAKELDKEVKLQRKFI
jgi:predicted metal-dependent hydrolase